MRTISELQLMQKKIQSDVVWLGVCQELKKKGVDPSRIIIADNFSEDGSQEYWAIVTLEKKIYEFYYDWLGDDVSKGKIIEWQDLTNNPSKVYMAESVKDVMKYFDLLTL